MKKIVSLVQCDHFDCEAKEEQSSVLERPFERTLAATRLELPHGWTRVSVARTGDGGVYTASITLCPEHRHLFSRTLAGMQEATEPPPGHNS